MRFNLNVGTSFIVALQCPITERRTYKTTQVEALQATNFVAKNEYIC